MITYEHEGLTCLQMYVPNNVKSFGSASHEFKVLGCANVHTLSVGQTQWNYLDRPSQKCREDEDLGCNSIDI